jgi:two-component system sensor histidine kinase KdpD
MGGTITAQSPIEEGKGTEISILLPAANDGTAAESSLRDMA